MFGIWAKGGRMQPELCSFCDEVRQANAGLGLSFGEFGAFIALPSLGCFSKGYSLLVPRAHVPSFAHLSEEKLRAADGHISSLRGAISRLFGEVVVAEHGSGAPDEPTAACCVHAHIHLIPAKGCVEIIENAYAVRGGQPEVLSSLVDVKRFEGASYLTLSPRNGVWLLWRNASRFPRQFIRRAASEAAGVGELFDWRAHPFFEEMAITSTAMKYSVKSSALGDFK